MIDHVKHLSEVNKDCTSRLVLSVHIKHYIRIILVHVATGRDK